MMKQIEGKNPVASQTNNDLRTCVHVRAVGFKDEAGRPNPH